MIGLRLSFVTYRYRNLGMKKLFPCLLAFQLAFFSVSAQLQLTLIVNNRENVPVSKVEVFDLSQQQIFTQPYHDTLNFSFSHAKTDVYNIRFHTGNSMVRHQLLLNNGKVTMKLTLQPKQLLLDTIINSAIYYESLRVYDSLTVLAKKADTPALNKFFLRHIEQNLDNVFSLMLANNYVLYNQNSVTDIFALKTYLDRQGGQLSWFLLHEAVNDRVNSILGTANVDLKKYRFTNINNKVVSHSVKDARYVVLDLWFLACAPCIEQHRLIKNNYEALKRYKVEMVGISIDKQFEPWKKYLTKHKYDWTNFREYNGKKISADLHISTYPTYIVLDNKGKMVRTFNSFDNVLEFVRN
jgi:hypothetical protein